MLQNQDVFDDLVIALDQAGAKFDAEVVAAELTKAGLKIVRVADATAETGENRQ